MDDLTRKIELRPTESSPLPILVVLLAGIVSLNVASAVLALLAA
jgi:hypothetical protein